MKIIQLGCEKEMRAGLLTEKSQAWASKKAHRPMTDAADLQKTGYFEIAVSYVWGKRQKWKRGASGPVLTAGFRKPRYCDSFTAYDQEDRRGQVRHQRETAAGISQAFAAAGVSLAGNAGVLLPQFIPSPGPDIFRRFRWSR